MGKNDFTKEELMNLGNALQSLSFKIGQSEVMIPLEGIAVKLSNQLRELVLAETAETKIKE